MTSVMFRAAPGRDNEAMTTTMMEFSTRTVGELAVEVPAAIRVFEAWKIDYCCGGRTPLPDACAAAGKSVDEFVAQLMRAASVPENAARDWAGSTLTTIATNIVTTYHDYTREELQTLAPLAAKVLGVHGERHPELAEVAALIADLTTDLVPHMLKEEQVLFPYVNQLEQGSAPTPFFGTVKNPVRMMMAEHDRVGELLARLRVTTSGYDVPGNACFSYRELYRRLSEFEARTHEHIHIENNLYFPRAVQLEDRVGKAVQGDTAGHACGCGH
jgi:regulator of cell morphogenesis and NO signaling